MKLIAIGGGFPGTSNSKVPFEAMAEAINKDIDEIFPMQYLIMQNQHSFHLMNAMKKLTNLFYMENLVIHYILFLVKFIFISSNCFSKSLILELICSCVIFLHLELKELNCTPKVLILLLTFFI